MPDRRSLPPMEAIEFAIEKSFRHFFFSIGLVLAWALLLSPVIAAAWYFAFRNGPPPDIAALGAPAKAALGVLGFGMLLASFSIAVNWHRRTLSDEMPRGLRWVRLDGVVWRYILGFAMLLVVLAVYAGVIFGILTQAVPALAPHLGPAAQPAGAVVAVLLGLSALFTFYRLWSWLAGIAVEDRAYTLRTAWGVTRGNRLNYLSFTFWLLFSLAIAGGLGAGAFFAQQMLPQPWIKPTAFGVMGVLGWMAMLFVSSVAASHYRAFAKTEDKPL